MLRQIAIVTLLNLKSLPSRLWASLVIVVGMAITVGVLLAMLSFTTGYVRAMTAGADPGRAIILSSQSQSETRGSSIPRDSLGPIMDAPGIAKGADGSPLADAESLHGLPATRKIGNMQGPFRIRGLGPKGLELRPEIKLVAGRMFRPGKEELVAGLALNQVWAHMNIGDTYIMPDGRWPIVGIFAGGGPLESEMIGDADTLKLLSRRDTYASVLVRLQTPVSLTTLRNALAANPSLSMRAQRQGDYFQQQAAQLSTYTAITYAVGGIMALGALFGALNTMYSAVAARGQEIATLRALGFGALPVAISVIAESVFLALTGALIGCAAAWLLFDGVQKAYYSDVFNLAVTPGLIALGLGWALVTAFLGGLLPSIRAARLTVVEALRPI